MKFFTQVRCAAAALAASLTLAVTPVSAQTTVNMYYPVAVGGPITKIIDKMVADFSAAHPDIKVNPIYSGSYQDTITKVITALKVWKSRAA